MIPKIVHYCWLSNDPLPKEAQIYIKRWKQILPDYEFMLWDFYRFDKKSSLWVSQAFGAKKYAFAADYIRLYALYTYGGIYMDTDVDVVQSFDPLLSLKTMLCYEDFGDRYEMATFGVEKGSPWVKLALDYYEGRAFIKSDGTYSMTVVPKIIVDVFQKNSIKTKDVYHIQEALNVEVDGYIPVLSSDFFSPKSYATGKVTRTKNTYSIHHFVGSWLPSYIKWEHKFWEFFGLNDPNITKRIVKYWNIVFGGKKSI